MNKKIIKIFSGIVAMVLLFSVNVCAAPKTMADGQKFDPEFYAATYPDVVTALGTDENVLYSHYLNNGKAEGRLPYADQGQTLAAKFETFKAKYPEGTLWTNETREYTIKTGKYSYMVGMGCAAFAFEASDFLFGTEAPYTNHYDYNNVKIGDILRVNNNTHSVVVMGIDSDNNGYTICEGNYNRSVHWGRHISRASAMDEYSYITTRY